MNGDGIDDFIIGASAGDPDGVSDAGESYVVFGRTERSPTDTAFFSLSGLDGIIGFVINGIDPNDKSGVSVSAAGDVNGDGIDDLIIGAPGAGPNGADSGESYVMFGREGAFGPSVELSALNGTLGFAINGIAEGDTSGGSVSAAGDVNGDGIDDLIIGASRADPNGNASGESYVVFGRATFSTDTGSVQVTVNGLNEAPTAQDDAFATNEATVLTGSVLTNNGLGADSDPNADTILSIAAVNGQAAGVGSQLTLASGALLTVNEGGTFSYDPNSAFDALKLGDSGTDTFAYTLTDGGVAPTGVIFDTSVALSELDGTTGFVLNGIAVGDRSGISVSAAGDINGDGIDDVIIGASSANPNGEESGESYVVFGRNTAFSASLELSELNGTTGFVINGVSKNDLSGTSVSAAGDVNGDGIDDLIIGAPRAGTDEDVVGESYVVFGRDTAFDASFELATLNGTNGFVIRGENLQDYSGAWVSSAGDVNGDGIDDLIIGAPYAKGNDDFSGKSYVVFGRETALAASFDLSTLNGTNGFVINGVKAGDNSGRSVSGAGDVNGDGVDDLIIGATLSDPNGDSSGESYVVFGRDTAFGPSFELSTLNGTNGFVINGIDAVDYSGKSVSSAGDVNGDGIDDLIIGAHFADPKGITNAGETYVVFGSTASFGASLELSALDGSDGFVITGVDAGDYSGRSVSAAGDVNGDGIDDLIIGARSADPNDVKSAGESYVVFGLEVFTPAVDVATATIAVNGLEFGPPPITGTAASENVNGTSESEIINALDGGDWITPGAGSDTVDGGDGRDMLNFGSLADTPGRTNVQYRLDLDLTRGTATTSGDDVYTITNIERVTGSIFADRIKGDAGDNDIRGLGDFDWLIGSEGSDNYEGGTGRDMVSYLDATAGVTVNLGDSSANTGLAAGDTYDSVERITGSVHIDVFFGDEGENDFRGLGGYDVFYSSTGGRERYDGGNGSDTVTYANATAGVIANLALGFGSGGDARADLYTSIENLGGSAFDDVLTGTDDRNNLRGLSGDDIIYGGGGIDRISGGRGDDTIDGGGGSDYILYSGDSSDFDITRDGTTRNAVVSWTGSGGGDGTDTLSNVEYMVFDDTTIDIWSL